MSSLLLVRAMDDLPRACREAGEIFAFHYRRRERNASGPAVLGIWIEARLAREVPAALSCRGWAAGRRTFPIRESAGVPGIWTICWLDAPGDANLAAVRGLIVSALTEGSGQDGAPGRFAPVFAANAAAEAVRAELRRLRERFPGRLVSPVLQDPATGRLLPLAASASALFD